MEERWRTIAGHPNYEVSDHGRVRRVTNSYRNIYKKGFILKPLPNGRGHFQLKLNGKMRYVHRLVLIAFVGPCPEGCECNHKDGVKANNHLSNLEWVTHSENMKHGYRTGLTSKGIKLNPQEVWLIRKLLKSNLLLQPQIAMMFKVNPSTISRINTGKYWA